MRLMRTEVFAPVFEPLRGKCVGYVQGQYGNAGDGLIHRATMQLFAAYGVEVRILNERPWRSAADVRVGPEVEEVVLFGGGSMGARLSGGLRRLARGCGRPMTLLPQSWRGMEAAPYARVFAREGYSRAHCPQAAVVPDLALALEWDAAAGEAVEAGGLFLRGDEEGLFAEVPSLGDPTAGLDRLDVAGYLARAGRYRRIVTDRLHFAIAGLMMRREVVLLPGSYPKNRGVWELSLRALGSGWAESPAAALASEVVPAAPVAVRKKMARGILMIAFGEKYRGMAAKGVRWLREAGCREPVRMVTSAEPFRIEAGLGVEVVVREAGAGAFASREWKTRMDELSPWEETLFLDADTLAVQSIDGVWAHLEGVDMAMARDVYPTLGARLFAADAPPRKEKEATLAAIPELEVAYHNSGVMLWRRGQETGALFAAWHREWMRHGMNDQLALARALHAVKPRVAVLPREWNASGWDRPDRAQAVRRGMRILHFWCAGDGRRLLEFA